MVAKKHKPVPISQSDFVYLLIPDRFANGNEANDNFSGMIDAKADRSSPFLRHSGDFEGIIQNLPYLQELGVTTLWNTPVIENDELPHIEALLETTTKVRYKHDGSPATIIQEADDRIKVLFHEPVSAIAPGQAAVFYEGNDVVGGGWISKSFRQEHAEI
ncbi:MAG: hypothetical protein EAZ70_11000 [Runella slithyformis]|nr:MAG: hypothetical protein EAY79_11440 [Runella slithyformis]TAF25012.1 MAG: hypothetical protein EAZ70_11000 [Runella slithyformis]TAF49820.1 MAG: hypothetical protein EAZ63_00340 [Runella slithyformis]TAF79598.1 MAG: hypothetical protein EAZ50_10885 [Runella slithyformis]